VLTGDPIVDNSSAETRVQQMGATGDVERALNPDTPEPKEKAPTRIQRQRR
jgi:hypothetical protein